MTIATGCMRLRPVDCIGSLQADSILLQSHESLAHLVESRSLDWAGVLPVGATTELLQIFKTTTFHQRISCRFRVCERVRMSVHMKVIVRHLDLPHRPTSLTEPLANGPCGDLLSATCHWFDD